MAPALPSKQKFLAEFPLKSFEVEGIKEDVIDINILANRWADAASHWGIAREAAAVFDIELAFQPAGISRLSQPAGLIKTKIEDNKLCSRYLAYYFEIPAVSQSPAWMKKILKTCGLKPINSVVDTLNYAMLEIGQPLHAFDASKIKGGLIIRKAKTGEKIKTIDNQNLVLNKDNLVIADKEKPLALAGIKGGQNSAVDQKTRAIVVEAATFDSTSIYKTSKQLKLITDASERFAHGLFPELAIIAINRAAILLEEICRAELKEAVDIYPKKQAKRFLPFDLGGLNRLIGFQFKEQTAFRVLRNLGFKIGKNNLIEIPFWRPDIDIFEDLVEEIIRIYGLSNIKAESPIIALKPPKEDEIFIFKDKIRKTFSSLGFSEVYNYSFSAEDDKKAIALENPIAKDKAFLRTSLLPALSKNIEDNLRFFEEVRIFEIGKVYFQEGREKWKLGIAVYFKDKEKALRDLRGALEEMLSRIGLVDYSFIPEKNHLRLKVDNYDSGCLEAGKDGVFAEIDLENLLKSAIGEAEYLPLSPYPSATRDLSFYVSADIRINDILEEIESLNTPFLIDVDLMDYYRSSAGSANQISLTFRFIFQSSDRTLSSEEINKSMSRIGDALKKKLNIKPR